MATEHERWMAAHALRSQLERVARRQGLGEAEAEEVASEAILRAARHADLDLDRLHSWATVVVRHLAVDVLRQRPSRAVLGRLHRHEPVAAVPSDRVDDAAEARWVATVVRRLPAKQRLVLEQRAAGHAPRDIARRLGTSDSAVESLTNRGRSTVRRALTATLGVVAAGVATARRGVAPATPALVLAVSAAVSMPLLDTPDQQPPVPPPAGHQASPAPVAQPTSRVQAARSLPALAPARSAGPLLPAPSPSGSPAPTGSAPARFGGVSVPGASYDGVSSSRSEQERTFLESVGDCLQWGPVVTPTHLGCPTPGG